jgi:hypothetical protein
MGPKYTALLDRLQNKNRLLVFALVVMLAFNLMNWFSLAKAKAESRVTIVPVVGGTGMWVGNGKASDEYLRAMARYISAMFGNFKAGTYRAQLQELLLLFPADAVGQAHADLMHLADEIDKYPSIAGYIQWSGDHPLKVDGDLIQIHVTKTRLVNGAETDERPLNSFYCVQYRIADTQFQLLQIEELSGDGDDLCLNKRANAAAGKAPPPAAAPAKKEGA